MSSKPIVGYWDVRGIGQVVRHLLVYAGVDFVDKRYALDENGYGAEWFAEKFSLDLDFPNLPYYIDSDVKLTQTLTILRYLAAKYGLDGTSSVEKLRISLAEQQIADMNKCFFTLAYNPNCDELKADYLAALPSQMTLLSKFLGQNDYVAGSTISYVDFWLYEYLIKIKTFVPVLFSQFNNFQLFVQRIEALPRIAEYIKAQGQVWIGGPTCRWNGKY